MKNLLIAAASVALLTALPAQAADLAATAASLRDKALTDPTAWTVLESLTTEVGARQVGSPAMTRAKDWSVETFKRLGFSNVKVESFETGAWSRGAESASVISPWPQPLHILGLGGSSPTPPGGLEAQIVVFPTYADLLAQPVGSLTGKIAVVTQPMTRTQDGSGYGAVNAQRTSGAVEAAKRGAVGYLVRSLSTDDTRLPHTGGAAPAGIPAAALSTVDAELLDRMAARGKPVTVRLDMASSFNPKAQAWNISGEIVGREKPDEVLVIGGHLDSWDVGTGAVDDAAGVAIMTGAAKVIAGLPKRPRRTIRVVMFGSEEQGGSGTAYATAHKDEIGKIVLVGESDSGAGAIWSADLPKGSRATPEMAAFAKAVAPLKVIVSRTDSRSGGADVGPMVRLGAPVVDLRQDASRYFDLHHAQDDTLDKVDPKELAQNVAVWTAFLYTVADTDIDFRKLATEAK
ncbi:MAG: M20/M25/M40 family metallo-hydrolase [Phenylobacterium sp.]|uniref:M20/M25/M40 family metallo-hydrolase n=1 Tax=Phenylobacterium sp. TaxID=1871053 RepID=UPI001B45AEA1|nr:M20/M25/M40 family metallo-hydrolase [Phenylobacterium sp.]MBP7814787.1 M20/M25/M40 family metallo-hydrolase [Phenylobacterium sp.]MBP9230910.1 M20/M25/M40 family metallo-hydrolase [Phenylobacterium sp.]